MCVIAQYMCIFAHHYMELFAIFVAKSKKQYAKRPDTYCG